MTSVPPRFLLPLIASLCTFGGCSSNNTTSPPTQSPEQDASPDATNIDASNDASNDTGSSCSPAASPGSPSDPSGYPSDGWTWHKQGVLLDDPGASALDGLLAPNAVVFDGAIHMWATRKKGLTHQIVYTKSTDGATFSDAQQLDGLGHDDVIAYPSVIREKGQWRMWFTSGTIDVAQSTDGLHWTVTDEHVLGPGQAGAFDSISVLYPTVVHIDDGYVMIYTGFNGQEFSLGKATSKDGVTWTKAGQVLSKGAPASFYNRSVAQSSVWRDGDGWLLWFGGYDTSKTDPGPYRVGLAHSTDGESFSVDGVTLDLAASGPDAHSTRGSSVVRWQGRWWMAYTGLGDDNRYRLLGAWSETCR